MPRPSAPSDTPWQEKLAAAAATEAMAPLRTRGAPASPRNGPGTAMAWQASVNRAIQWRRGEALSKTPCALWVRWRAYIRCPPCACTELAQACKLRRMR